MWHKFERTLVEILLTHLPRTILVISAKDREDLFVQFQGIGMKRPDPYPFMLTTELSAFSSEEHLTSEQTGYLNRVGFLGAPKDVLWINDKPWPVASEDILRIVQACTLRLRDIGGVSDPAQLQYRAFSFPEDEQIHRMPETYWGHHRPTPGRDRVGFSALEDIGIRQEPVPDTDSPGALHKSPPRDEPSAADNLEDSTNIKDRLPKYIIENAERVAEFFWPLTLEEFTREVTRLGWVQEHPHRFIVSPDNLPCTVSITLGDRGLVEEVTFNIPHQYYGEEYMSSLFDRGAVWNAEYYFPSGTARQAWWGWENANGVVSLMMLSGSEAALSLRVIPPEGFGTRIARRTVPDEVFIECANKLANLHWPVRAADFPRVAAELGWEPTRWPHQFITWIGGPADRAFITFSPDGELVTNISILLADMKPQSAPGKPLYVPDLDTWFRYYGVGKQILGRPAKTITKYSPLGMLVSTLYMISRRDPRCWPLASWHRSNGSHITLFSEPTVALEVTSPQGVQLQKKRRGKSSGS